MKILLKNITVLIIYLNSIKILKCDIEYSYLNTNPNHNDGQIGIGS